MPKVVSGQKSLLIILLLLSIEIQVYGQPTLFGTTPTGGTHNAGVLFGLPAGASSYTQSFSFTTNGGSNPYNDLVQASNGKLYGMTEFGGTHNEGVLFEFDPLTNIFTDKISFSIENGSNPTGGMVQANNGKLYGMTRGGGNGSGVLFEFDPVTNIYIKKLDLNHQNGSRPMGSLIKGSNGKLYGMTLLGGIDNDGVLFEYDPATNSLIKKVDFANDSKGRYPYGNLVQLPNGKFYGMTSEGGEFGTGCIFEYDASSNTFIKKIDLGILIGIYPHGALLLANNGKLYGITNSLLFQYDPTINSIIPIVNFDRSTTGTMAFGSLIQTANGKIYGLTSEGGSNNKGTLFEFDLENKTLIKKVDLLGTSNGATPYGSLIQLTDGSLYGLTSKGGVNNVGILFEFNPVNNSIINKHNFKGALDGKNPECSLLKVNDKFYGVTTGGGINDDGVLFEYNPLTGEFNKKVDFDAIISGKYPKGKLIQASNGKIYGVTNYGGLDNNRGVLYEYDIETNQISKKVDFGANIGGNPDGFLSEISSNKLYGASGLGGGTGIGGFFEYDIATNVLVSKIDYENLNPSGRLTKTTSGKFFGMTNGGGANGNGLIYEFSPIDNLLTKKIDFETITHGYNPIGVLIEGSNNKLYGSTSGGGVTNLGVIFEYDPENNIYTKKYTFSNSANGVAPSTSLTQSVNGKLYGMTYYGGVNHKGVIFEFDLLGSQYTKKVDLGFELGSNPLSSSSLSEICLKPMAIGPISSQSLICNLTPTRITINPLPFVDNYDWSLPAGATIITGENSNSIEIDFKNVIPGDYSVSVSGKNICGDGPASIIPIVVHTSPTIPATIVTQPTCSTPTGTITIDIQNTADQYSFDNGVSFQQTNNKSGLNSGNRQVVIKNTIGCTNKTNVTILPDPKPSKPLINVNFSNPESPLLSVSTYENYKWYLNGNLIPGATSNSLSAVAAGLYTIIVTANGCDSDPSLPVTLVVVGIKDASHSTDHILFPNPTSFYLTLSVNELKEDKPVDITVYSMTGQLIYQTTKTATKEIIIDVANYPNGSYLISLQQEGMYFRTQFIKGSK